MALLTPPTPAGTRAISSQPWFVKPTITTAANSVVVALPVALAYYHVKAMPSWNTVVYMSAQTTKNCTLRFSTPAPAGGQLLVEISA